MRFRHPSGKRLAHWLEGELPELDDHIDTCERCANRLEQQANPGPGLSEALRRALAPPTDLAPRLTSGIANKMQTRQDLQTIADLMGLPIHTARALNADNTERDG